VPGVLNWEKKIKKSFFLVEDMMRILPLANSERSTILLFACEKYRLHQWTREKQWM